MRVETEKNPLQGMFSTEEIREEVMEKMVNNETLRRRLNHSLFDTCSVRTRSGKDALFGLLRRQSFVSRSITGFVEAISRNQKRLSYATSTVAEAERE